MEDEVVEVEKKFEVLVVEAKVSEKEIHPLDQWNWKAEVVLQGQWDVEYRRTEVDLVG